MKGVSKKNNAHTQHNDDDLVTLEHSPSALHFAVFS